MDPSHQNGAPRATGEQVEQMSSSSPLEPDPSIPQAVRFASVNQEIEPSHSLRSDSQMSERMPSDRSLSPQAQEEIRSLSLNLRNSHIQQQRMSSFAFEPVSLPVSRAPSNESTQYHSTEGAARSGGPAPVDSPPTASMPTPPLTPSATHYKNPAGDTGRQSMAKVYPDPTQMTPQTSGPGISSGSAGDIVSSSAATSRPESPVDGSTPPTSKSADSTGPGPSRKEATFIIGKTDSASSPSQSRDHSPSRGYEAGSGTTTPGGSTNYVRPFTPQGDRNDPYSRNKRPPQSRNLDAIDDRFRFNTGDQRRRSGIGFGSSSTGSSSTALPRSSSGSDLKNEQRNSRMSMASFGGTKKEVIGEAKHHGSMSELKRFFFGHNKSKRAQSPAASLKPKNSHSGTKTPPRQQHTQYVPFADDHGLVEKYGKFGKILGSGAGGSVRLMKRSQDGVTFAVKQFRERHSYESEREYNKKVTAEFCIGSTLHHGNIIETLDIIHEAGKWYEVMEYAPYDLFACVMTGKMSKEEVNCCFFQIVAGVAFLHGSGLAHRDLKLDNVVVNGDGIMKLIDFGSASVFRYPFENDIILATGVVGSDPYLAPEVYDNQKYDPQPADIWSLAIIYACMSLRRFPWKAPRQSDNSFKLFTAEPSPGTPGGPELPKEDARPVTTPGDPAREERRNSEPGQHHHHHHHSHHESGEPGSRIDQPKHEVIKGPWRLLRLIPREARVMIGNMLVVNPKKRATLELILSDPWLKDSPVCEQLEGGRVMHHGNHQHTLEPSSSAPAAK